MIVYTTSLSFLSLCLPPFLSLCSLPTHPNTLSFSQPTGIILQFFFYLCDSKSRDIALGVLYGYKAVLQVAALVFSFSIRKVKVKGVNDAKYVAAAVYVTSIVTAVIFVSLYSLKTFVNLYAALFSLGFFIGTSVILVLVFIPKVMKMHACNDQFESKAKHFKQLILAPTVDNS